MTPSATSRAEQSRPRTLHRATDTVLLPAQLSARGFSAAAIAARVSARRWRRFGRALVLHNGPLRREEAQRASLLNCRPRAVLTSFTAAEVLGLDNWRRDDTHVLVPGGTRIRRVTQLSTRVHYTGDWSAVREARDAVQEPAAALVIAAGSFRAPRAACGILAAGVQQRLVGAGELFAALQAAARVRHHEALTLAAQDIAQGSEALSEIEFVRLCRRNGLPGPDRQSVRREPSGRRRYLDAEWRRPDGRRVVVEIDGALHLIVTNWYTDQLRQNEVALGGAIMLRFPSVVVRTEQAVVVDQLRRALDLVA